MIIPTRIELERAGTTITASVKSPREMISVGQDIGQEYSTTGSITALLASGSTVNIRLYY